MGGRENPGPARRMSEQVRFEPPTHRKLYPSRCALCGGSVREEVVSLTYPWAEGRSRIVENVPAGVCQACHERYLRPEVVRRIEEILRVPPTRQVEVPLWSWDEVHARAGFTTIPKPSWVRE